MKYSPGPPQQAPEQNHNVSHEHPLREFFVLLVAAIAAFMAVILALGLLVDRAVAYIDPQTEAQLFASRLNPFSTAEKSSPGNNAQIQALLDRVGDCIDVGYPVAVEVVDSKEINAFAMPGGRVVVLSGLVDEIHSENGLAFVLAHELAHYKNRDHLRAMGRTIVLIAGAALLTGVNSDITSLLTPVYSVEWAQYSQERESAADALALDALHCLYGHVAGATELFDILRERNLESDWSVQHYFASHPEAGERIGDLEALAAQKQLAISGALVDCELCAQLTGEVVRERR